MKENEVKKDDLSVSSDLTPSPNPFVNEGFRLSSRTHKCCCVAVRIGADGTVDVRDTKSPNGPTITYNRDEWAGDYINLEREVLSASLFNYRKHYESRKSNFFSNTRF
jgi:hypothetical protein